MGLRRRALPGGLERLIIRPLEKRQLIYDASRRYPTFGMPHVAAQPPEITMQEVGTKVKMAPAEKSVVSRLPLAHPRGKVIKVPLMLLRKLAALIALTGLLTTASVADTSLCRMFCAAHMAFGGSSKPSGAPHVHHSAMSGQKTSAHTHSRCTGNPQSIVSCGMSMQSSPCTQYQQLARFLDTSRVSVTERVASNGNHALFPALLIEEITEAAPLPPISPPGSCAFPRSTPTFLRI